MYDHNQTLIPDSFLAIHARHGRPTLSREEAEAHYEICEDIALHAAAFLAGQQVDEADTSEALRRCHAGLLAEPRAVSEPEARWVAQRVAELQEWPCPAWLVEGGPPGQMS